jgi:hypothetical protein
MTCRMHLFVSRVRLCQVGHYGFEAEEEALVIFVGVIPVVIDVFFKYWIFIGLNRISPGAVVTIKQVMLGATGLG